MLTPAPFVRLDALTLSVLTLRHNVKKVYYRAEQEARITSEKDEHIKTVEAEILQLKADIYNLKVSS